MRFRKERVALVADVEAMFHQVFVKPSHVDALRFLWWPIGEIDQEPVVHRMLVHIFGAKSSPTCANFALKQTAAEFGHLFEPNMSEIVNKHFYFDDCLVPLPSVAEAVTAQTQLCDLLSKRGFRLRKWLSNSSEVFDQIPEAERSKALQSYSFSENVSEHVLGVHWDVEKDIFTFNVNLREFSNTKRDVLSTIAILYDPLGFVCPIVLEPKLLFQQLCRQKFGWDVSISDPELEKWQRWLNRLQELSHVPIPRCFTPKNLKALKSIEIHNFADASSYAYAACSYLRLVDTGNNIFCAFVIAKSRLAPIKAVSIPRLELTAAVLAVRLNALVKGELKFDVCQSHFWIDSTAVLLSILNRSKRFPIFVANRLAIIQQSSDPSEWHFLPSKLNAADLPSRGLMDKPIDCLNSWVKGPQFLWESKALWPQFPVKLDAQFPKEFSPLKHQTVFSNIVTENDCAILRLIERCSSLYKLKRLMAWLLRCQTKFSRRTKISKLEPPDLSLRLKSCAAPRQNSSNFYIELIFLTYSLNRGMQNKLLQKICHLVCFQKGIVTPAGVGPKCNSLVISFGVDG